MHSEGLIRRRLLPIVLALALCDWVIAVGMVVGGVRRPLALPLLVVAAAVLASTQLPRLRRITAAVRGAENGTSRWIAAERAIGVEWSPRVARLVLREPRLLWSVVLLVRGRRDGDPYPTFSAHRGALPVWLAMAGLTVAELAVTPLLPLPAAVEPVLLVLGFWGLLLVAGLVAALVVHPHVVEPSRVRLRTGTWDEIVLARADIERVARRTTAAPRGLTVADGVATLSPDGTVDVALRLARPVQVRGLPVTEVHVAADHPDRFVAALRDHRP